MNFKKVNCQKWSENVDGTLPALISFQLVEFEMLSVNTGILENLVCIIVYEVI